MIIMLSSLSTPNGFVLEGFLTHCSFDYISRDIYTRTYMLTLILIGFLLPLIVIITIYILLWKKIRKINLRSNNARLNRLNRLEIRLIKTILLMVIMYCLAWTPYTIVTLIAQFAGFNINIYINPFSTNLPCLFAKLSSIYNPIIYILSNKKNQNFLKNKYFSRFETFRISLKLHN